MMFVTARPVLAGEFVGREHELWRVGDHWLHLPLKHYGAIIGPRQIGKTSLLYRIADEFADRGVFALVNAQLLNGSPDRQLRELSCQIVEKLGLEHDEYLTTDVSSSHDFLRLLRRLVHQFPTGQVVIMLDRAGCIHEQVAVTIRAAFTEGAGRDTPLSRLFFILADAQNFLPLITVTSTLYSVLDVLPLCELSIKETKEILSIGFSEDVNSHDAVMPIFDWSSGHPYLVQAIGQKLAAERQTVITKDMVDRAVEGLMEDDPHLRRVINSLSQLQPAEQALFQDIVSQPSTVLFGGLHPAIAELELLGLIRKEGDNYVIRNRIYLRLIRQYLQYPLRRGSQLLTGAVHDLLVAAYTADDLRRLIRDSENQTLHPLLNRFSPTDGLEAMLDEVIGFCQKRDLLHDLLQEVERDNPRQFKRFRGRLYAPRS